MSKLGRLKRIDRKAAAAVRRRAKRLVRLYRGKFSPQDQGRLENRLARRQLKGRKAK